MAALGTLGGMGASTVLLIGLRGAGKSTLGRELAAEMGRNFVDLDDVTPQALGARNAREAWETHGEAKFREAEVAALRRVLKKPGQVVALGGGTPTAPGAREVIATEQREARAVVIYLRADAASLRERLAQSDNAHRPSLTGAGVLDEIEQVLEKRDGLYLALADEAVEVGGLGRAEALAQLRLCVCDG